MAIDTAAKLKSASSAIGLGTILEPEAAPFDNITLATLNHIYGGIAFDAPVVPPVVADDKRSLLIPLMSTMLVR